MTYVPNELLSRLVGGRLVAVTFVLDDYLQLQFDDATMNVDAWPTVHYADRTWRILDVGYADSLRRLCGSTVAATSERTGDGLRITLETGEIHINPTCEDASTEIATLTFGGHASEWMCWRPGEHSFEHLAQAQAHRAVSPPLRHKPQESP